MIKLIIFDFTNVCFTEEEKSFLTQFTKEHDIDFGTFSREYDARILPAERGERGIIDAWKELKDMFQFDEQPEEIISEMMKGKHAMESTLNLAKRLRQGYTVAYFTNYGDAYWDEILKNFDLTQWFDDGIVSFQIKSRKPEKEGFIELMRRHDAKPEETIFIDDTVKNVAAARALGINAIQFTTLETLKKELAILEVTTS